MNKKYPDDEEKALAESFERGEWQPVKNQAGARKTLRDAARHTLQKDARINIRLSSKDLRDVQTIAAREGIPYQTLLSSIIHKYVCGSLTDRLERPANQIDALLKGVSKKNIHRAINTGPAVGREV
jgi:predicted DNA binding CopG/RHH family protein